MTPPDWTRGLLAWLATYGLHSTLFLGAVWAFCRLRPPQSVRSRERLWRLGLLGGLLTATLQVGLGARPLLGRIEWEAAPEAFVAESKDAPSLESVPDVALLVERPPRHRREPTHPRVTTTVAPALRELQEDARPTALGELPVEERIVATPPPPPERTDAPRELPSVASATADAAPPVPPAASPIPRIEPPSRLAAWPGLVLLGWTALGIAGLAGLALSWAFLWRSLLGRRPLHGGPLVAHVEELRRRAGVKRRVRLSTSTRLTSPVSLGIFRPEICLPLAALSQLTAAQQQALLAHELGHAVRRDPLWFGVYTLVERLLFFQPLNRVARRQLQELAEIASDDWAVRWTGARVALASCLAEVAGWILRERSRTVVVPGLAGHRSRLGRRIERLLDDRRSPTAEPRAPWWPPLAGAALAAVTLAVPGVSATVSALAEPEPAKPEKAADASAPGVVGLEPALPPAPVSEAPAAPAADPLPPVEEVQAERELLAGELALLEAEIAELRLELGSQCLEERFASAMSEIEQRMRELRAQHELARTLLESPNTPP